MKLSAYPHLDGLVDLACRDGVDVRPTLLRVITDLYVQKPVHSADEVTQYVELTLGLIDTVDDATRTAVSASLAHYPAAPAAVMARLGMIAPPAASVLPDVDFAAVEEQDSDTGTDGLIDLFFDANAEDRRIILLYFDAAAMTSAPLPAPASIDLIRTLENAALQRNTAEFSRIVERAMRLPHQLAERITRDASGEPIVVVAKALGMKAAVLQRILLFINPKVGQSVQRIYDLADLFEELTHEAAERMLTIWRGDSKGAAPVHQPVYGADGKRDGRMQTAQGNAKGIVQQPATIQSAG